VLWSLLNAMVDRFPGDPWIPTLPELRIPLLKLSSAIVGAAVGAAVMGKFLPRTTIFQRLVLNQATSKDEGYSSSKDSTGWKGKNGVTLSPLYPAGSAMIDDQRLDVITRGEYIPENARVRVVETPGNRII